MKILFDHPHPFLLAHGGFRTQIEQTRLALHRLGHEVEWLRWWDESQRGDLLHFFGVAPSDYLAQARSKRLPTAMTPLFTATCNRPDWKLRLQGAMVRAILAAPIGSGIKRQLEWRSFQACDCNVVGLEAERRVLEMVYQISAARIAVVPLGLSEAFLTAGPGPRSEPHLVCVGTITERKNCVPLAELAHRAEVPILFVGKPYTEADPYWHRFQALIDDRWVKYHPHVGSEREMITLLQQARGAAIMSQYENWCLAAHEAAACGLPLILPDLKWSRERFGPAAHYFSNNREKDVEILRSFYAACSNLPAPAVKLYSWDDVGSQLANVYERTLAVHERTT